MAQNTNQRTTVLFTQKESIYEALKCDCWDYQRNALNFEGTNPVIAHPPCRAWGKLKKLSKPRPGEKYLAVWAINLIRKNGGILEHPSTSDLWTYMKLPKPGQTDEFGGWTLYIDQYWFGHKAKKPTFLYIKGISPKELPEYPIKLHTGKYKHTVETITKKDRERTPETLAKWLIQVTNLIQIKSQTGDPDLNTLILKLEN